MSPGDTAVSIKKYSLEGQHLVKLHYVKQLTHSIERYVAFLKLVSLSET